MFQNLGKLPLYILHSFIFCENFTSEDPIEFLVTFIAALTFPGITISQGLWTTVPSSKLKLITLTFKRKVYLE